MYTLNILETKYQNYEQNIKLKKDLNVQKLQVVMGFGFKIYLEYLDMLISFYVRDKNIL